MRMRRVVVIPSAARNLHPMRGSARRRSMRTSTVIPVAALAWTLAAFASTPPKPVIQSRGGYSDAFTIDTTWASMKGPYRVMEVTLTDTTRHDIVWVVGYEAAIVDADTKEPKSSEFMCHSNVDFDM